VDLTQMRSVILADGSGQTLPQKGVQTLLLLGCIGLVWAAVRAREVRLWGRPGIASRALVVMAAAALVLAFVVPAMLGVKIAPVRPSTDASVAILSPQPQQVLRGSPATVRVRLRLVGARIVAGTSTHLVPGKGHIHLYLDGQLLTMTHTTSTTIEAYPASHRLEAEFVAVDHGPFSPPVTASVRFTVIP
jgi:hypothetical protein